jgi:hypothetical protein
LCAFSRRKPLVASCMAAAVQRIAIEAERHRFTLRQTRRTVPITFSMMLVQVAHRHYRPAANETALDLRRAVGTEVVHWLGAHKPAYKLDPGFLEHPRLSPRAVIGCGARFLDF